MAIADIVFKPLLEGAGNPLPLDHLKLVTLLISTYPLAKLYRALFVPPPTKILKVSTLYKSADEVYSQHFFSIVFSIIVFSCFFDLIKGYMTLLVSIFATYFITYFEIGGKRMPWVAFIFVMGHMTLNHLYRQLTKTSLDVFEITGPQMVLCMKLTSFAWNVHDGRQSQDHLNKLQQYKAIKKIPGIISFLGYCFFFPSFLVGPSFDYVEYENFITLSMFIDHQSKKSTDPIVHVPSSSRISLIILIQGLIFLILYATFGNTFPPEQLFSKEFKDYSFIYVFIILQITAAAARLKYYGVWTIADASCVAVGLGFQGHTPDGKSWRWDRVKNIDPWKYESAQNLKILLDNWNMNTNKWLRNYVYVRVAKPGKKPGFKSSLATFTVSALWHGLYPGYYFTFISAAFELTVARLFRKFVRPLFFKSDSQTKTFFKVYYDIFSWFVTQTSINYTILPFLLLEVQPALAAWKRVYFHVHIITFNVLGFFYLGGANYLTSKIKMSEIKSENHFKQSTEKLNLVAPILSTEQMEK